MTISRKAVTRQTVVDVLDGVLGRPTIEVRIASGSLIGYCHICCQLLRPRKGRRGRPSKRYVYLTDPTRGNHVVCEACVMEMAAAFKRVDSERPKKRKAKAPVKGRVQNAGVRVAKAAVKGLVQKRGVRVVPFVGREPRGAKAKRRGILY